LFAESFAFQSARLEAKDVPRTVLLDLAILMDLSGFSLEQIRVPLAFLSEFPPKCQNYQTKWRQIKGPPLDQEEQSAVNSLRDG
jgi:hypothetical protein